MARYNQANLPKYKFMPPIDEMPKRSYRSQFDPILRQYERTPAGKVMRLRLASESEARNTMARLKKIMVGVKMSVLKGDEVIHIEKPARASGTTTKRRSSKRR